MHKAYDMLSAVANDASSTFINDALSSILFKKKWGTQLLRTIKKLKKKVGLT
jgi:hypothetical protein